MSQTTLPRIVMAFATMALLSLPFAACSHDATTYRSDASTVQAAAATTPATAPAMTAATPVEVESGTELRVRLSHALSSATATDGQTFQAAIADPVLVNGQVVIPPGAEVTGQVVAADAAGHFQGQARLALTLTALRYGGESYALSTPTVTRLAAPQTHSSEETIGGGAAVGAFLGALVGHGKGAAVGAISGAGAGTLDQALSHPPEVRLPAETLLRFRLTSPLQVVPNP